MLELRHAEAIRALPPARKLLYLVLLLAIKDGASEVRFEPLTPGDVLGPEFPPWNGGESREGWVVPPRSRWHGCRVRYYLGGTWYDMVPVPVPVHALSREVAALTRLGFIHRPVRYIHRWLAALRGARPRPLESRLRLLVGGKEVEVLACLGAPLVLHLSPGDAGQDAHDLLKSVLELHRAGEVIS
jgi:hypothetical protein